MKNIFCAVFYLGFCVSFSAQDNAEIIKHINNLSDQDKRNDAISFLNNIIKEDRTQLQVHSDLLSDKMNSCLKNEVFDFRISVFALNVLGEDLMTLDKQAESSLVQQNQKLRRALRQDLNYQDWIWQDHDYLEKRTNSGLLLDLLGYGSEEISLDELKIGFEYFIDTRPKYFALISLIKRGETFVSNQLLSIAADDETRGFLFNHLQEINQLNLFPSTFNNQKALSKANMVNWLVYPTELGRVPTEIEFIQTVEIVYDDVGPADFYLWKFRADDDDWKDEGWMVGLSGPFVRSESPSMEAYGYTFSVFSKLEDKSIREHFDEIVEVIGGIE